MQKAAPGGRAAAKISSLETEAVFCLLGEYN